MPHVYHTSPRGITRQRVRPVVHVTTTVDPRVAQVEKVDRDRPALPDRIGHLTKAGTKEYLLPVSVQLGTIGNDDLPMTIKRQAYVVQDGPHHRAVSDDLLPLVRPVLVRWPEQVGLDDDSIARAHDLTQRVPLRGAGVL